MWGSDLWGPDVWGSDLWGPALWVPPHSYDTDLVVCVALGCDMFDCVFPTRTAVMGGADLWGRWGAQIYGAEGGPFPPPQLLLPTALRLRVGPMGVSAAEEPSVCKGFPPH